MKMTHRIILFLLMTNSCFGYNFSVKEFDHIVFRWNEYHNGFTDKAIRVDIYKRNGVFELDYILPEEFSDMEKHKKRREEWAKKLMWVEQLDRDFIEREISKKEFIKVQKAFVKAFDYGINRDSRYNNQRFLKWTLIGFRGSSKVEIKGRFLPDENEKNDLKDLGILLLELANPSSEVIDFYIKEYGISELKDLRKKKAKADKKNK